VGLGRWTSAIDFAGGGPWSGPCAETTALKTAVPKRRVQEKVAFTSFFMLLSLLIFSKLERVSIPLHSRPRQLDCPQQLPDFREPVRLQRQHHRSIPPLSARRPRSCQFPSR